MAAGRQLRLLLWKDYLIRKRKLVTLAGIIWATMVMMCLYVVRINVDNQDFPTCQFPARALPSAGMLTFVQSFICSVDNDCSPMENYQEIPTYENSKLTQLQRRFSPLLHNETVLEVAGTVPGALKLLATFADVLDDPVMVDISKDGLRVSHLFTNPRRVKRYLAVELNVSDAAANELMEAKLSLTAIFNSNIDRCNVDSIASLLQMENQEHLKVLVQRLCDLTDQELEKMASGLLIEVNFSKYITMISKMYYKVSGDARVPALANMVSSALRLVRLESFLPPAASALLLGKEVDFSYFNMTWITERMDQLEPIFGGTKTYQALRDFIDMVSMGLDYLDKLLAGQSADSVRQATGLALAQVGKFNAGSLDKIGAVFNNAVDLFENTTKETLSVDIFKILTQVTNMINKFLPDDKRHEVLLYSTLLSKLIECANRVVAINLNIQDMAYDVSLRNPAGVQVLMSLPVGVVRKGFEGLADAERVQMLTSKLNVNGQMFCDSTKLAGFFKVSKAEADSLKTQLCTDAWKDYIGDFVKSFGIYYVRDMINNMASLIVQETFGKDISDQLYTIEQDFDILKNFTQTLVVMRAKEPVRVDWPSLLNVTQDSDFMKIFEERGNLGKQILITVHGALAKEVVKQNAILDYKISPLLLDFTTLLLGVRDQLELAPRDVIDRVKRLYPDILQTMLMTLLDEHKTYRALSSPGSQVFCGDLAVYLQVPSDANAEGLRDALCGATRALDAGLSGNSSFASAIAEVKQSSHGILDQVDWTALIDLLKHLYLKLDADYPYLFAFTSYGMDEQQETVEQLMEKAKEYWFSLRRLDRTLHLSVKMVFRILDVVDREAFNVTSEGWLRMKHAFHSARGQVMVVDDLLKTIAGLTRNESLSSQLPPITSQALSAVIPGLPQLVVNATDLILNQDVQLEPILELVNSSPAWPCSNDSISTLVPLSGASVGAVRALESLMCIHSGVKEEWTEYLSDNNISLYNASAWNSTKFSPHEFLAFSGAFDALVEDTALVHQLVQTLRGDEGDTGIVGAWGYAANAFKGTDRNESLRTFFSNIDAIINSVSIPLPPLKSASALWEQQQACGSVAPPSEECGTAWRLAWKATLQAMSLVVRDAAEDLLVYFTEINEPSANVLQMLGFTRETGLFVLYEKLPELVAALLNSYWDYGFMSQVRRAALTQFWDCPAVVSALAPGVGGVGHDVISRVKPFVCPSLLYWISLPRGANTFLDLIAKPQYTFYTLPAENLTSSFADAFNKTTELISLLARSGNKTEPPLTEEDTKLSTLQEKLKTTVDTVLNYKLQENDSAYRLFNEINRKQFMSATYLTRITVLVNKIATALEHLKPSDISQELSDDDAKKLESELSAINKIFKRRPSEAIAVHFDVISNILSKDEDNFELVKGLDELCEDFKNNDTSKDILNDGPRTKNQICSKQYKEIFGAVQDVIDDDYEAAKKSLFDLVNALQDSEDDVSDVIKFFKDRKKLINNLKSSIRYAYDLSLPIYLKYLQSNLQSYNIVLGFLSGDDWWAELRAAYTGPRAGTFFDAVEGSFEIAEDILTKLDEIHLVRLLRDVNLNDSSSFCQPNVSLSDYVPDATGTLTRLQRQACAQDPEELFREIPPLVFASQGYNDEMQLSKEINYTALYADISETEARLEAISEGPRTPQRPGWVTDEKLGRLRGVALQLLSNETLIKISFGVLSNVVDASTLFLNNTQCAFCSHLTSFLKQVNLQLYKKQEYDALLCRLEQAPRQLDVHLALHNDFHWDMALRELVSFRNYTKLELNKAVHELLAQARLHALEGGAARARPAACLAPGVPPGPAAHAALLLKVVAHTLTLIRAELPHIHEVEGMAQVPLLQELREQVAPRMDAFVPLAKSLRNGSRLKEELAAFMDDQLVQDVMSGDINARLINKIEDEKSWSKYLRTSEDRPPWSAVCASSDCKKVLEVIDRNINKTLATKDLTALQDTEFWKFSFITDLLRSAERLAWWVARLVGLAGRADGRAVLRGDLAAVIDLVLEATTQEVVDTLHYSIHGVLHELGLASEDGALRRDLAAVTKGLGILKQFRDKLAAEDVKVPVASLCSDPERLEAALDAQGINNTNFWSLAAPRLHAGYISLKPILSWKSGDHISNYVCQPDSMALVLQPDGLGAVSADEVYGAVGEQLCGLGDARAKRLALTLLRHANYSYVLEQITDFLLPKLYSAANLTLEEGSTVMDGLPLMAQVLPGVQARVGEVADSFSQEPLFQSLVNFSSVGGLLGSSSFLSSAGNMLCGKPFVADVPRLYRSVIAGEDHASQPDEQQLEVLPTEFCRSLYQDIISVEGGKIVWSFVKPLIMGRVLYTPATPLVADIIQRANSSFAHMARLASLIQSFADSFPAVDQLSAHREGVGVLSRLLGAPTFKELRAVLMQGGDGLNVDLEEMFDDFGDISGIGSILSKVSNLLRCINLDRFHAAATEDALAREAARLTLVNEFSAGLVFLNSEQQAGAPTNMRYKIRMDIENAPTTRRLKNYLWIPGPEANFLENMRYFRGFVQIQDLVDRAIVDAARDASLHRDTSHRDISRRKRDTEEDFQWAAYTQQMPYPCYRKDFFQTSLYESQALIVAFFFSLLFSVAAAVRFVVADHESGNTMLMHVMGVQLSLHTLSWFLWSLLEMVLTCACVTLVLCAGGVLPRTDPSLVFTLIAIFGLSVLCFCYMISKLFNKASFAAVCAAIAYLISFMPIVLILSLEAVISRTAKIVICLFMSSSLCYAFLHITRLEATGVGAHWATLWDVTDDGDVSVGVAALTMIVDAALYAAVGWAISRYCGLKTLQSNISYCTTSDEKAGVSVVNVTKVYGGRSRRQKVALDNVSMELHKGQVTALLGHNGAGKTTLIKILTGMLKPTSGHVVIRASSTARAVGACPQRDVLYEHMSAREHVALYAQLKSGRSAADVRDEVDSMLEVLSLGHIRDVPADKLSGGTRRRLCVALAFVGAPRLVALDEPTAGVDPAARREIWSMIERLKEDRTILLTTHHLDEADLLSDQVVILHKGQVHTTGSPIEIKRTLGNGYKLSVTYPLPWGEEPTLEERSKPLLALVRAAVRDASLLDVGGRAVELTLPFYDADGLNNNFLQVCTALEDNQETLGFSDYALECSSLEQVFYNVCQQADHQAPQPITYETSEDTPSKSASTASIRTEGASLAHSPGPLAGSAAQQFLALMRTRYLHYIRNRWLLFTVLVLPSLFVGIAMGFATIRPPADNEISLLLHPDLYANTTEFLVPQPSVYSDQVDPSFARRVMEYLMLDQSTRNWTAEDTPSCSCGDSTQICHADAGRPHPAQMLLPDVGTLNDWIVSTQKEYIQERYGGYSSALANNITNLVAWYNNKGHHALPAYLGALHTAALRVASGDPSARITTYSHPMKISKEQISKDTVYQHVADAGISGLVVLGYSLASAGAAVYLVNSRVRQEKRLQLLCGVSPALYWTAALAADMIVIAINMALTAALMEAFHFPVFVSRANLPAICLLILLYGFACGSLVHCAEKLFSEASVANMLVFCANALLGLGGLTVLLILDVISDSERTDNARWTLHKLFLLAPQFALGDGLLEIAKNTIQAQVLSRFGMDTYKDPLGSDLVAYHYLYLVLVGFFFFSLNLAIEYQCFDFLLAKFWREHIPQDESKEPEDPDVVAERARVLAAPAAGTLRLRTIGNINAGFVDTEGKISEVSRATAAGADVAACVRLSKVYPTRGKGPKVALRDLTLGLPPGECTVLLGENGAGKSSTFALLTGQLRPSAGAVRVAGRPRGGTRLCEGLISYCPQSDAVDPLLTVRETLSIYCRLRGIDDEEEVIKRTMDTFELLKYSEVRAGALSGGNKRKLCTAIAFMSRAPLVLLDEPTSGMDPGSRACVTRAALAARAAGRALLVSTHNAAEARALAARAALLRAGRLRALAPLHRCLHRFGGGYVVECKVSAGGAREVWRRVVKRAPHARAQALHRAALHFLLPSQATVDGKEVTTRPSDVFRLMAALQGECGIDDYTVNQSSLEQMFLGFSERGSSPAPPALAPLPSPRALRLKDLTDLTDVTSL